MLSIIGFIMVLLIILLLLRGKSLPVVVMFVVPIIAALFAGFHLSEVGTFVMDGINKVTGIIAMFIFAILYFGVMTKAGLFEPLIRKLVKSAGNNIVAVAMVTAIIAMLAHIEGVGAATFLITIPALLPIYRRLNMRPTTLLLLVGLSAGTMNMIPWGGPTLRAATTLDMDVVELWKPLIPIQIIGLLTILIMTYIIAKIEIKRGAGIHNSADALLSSGTSFAQSDPLEQLDNMDEKFGDLLRPKLWWFNVSLTIAAIGVLVWGVVPPAVVFMAALTIALPINYRGVEVQSHLIKIFSPEAILMATVLMAAGSFLGILSGTGMVDVMASDIVRIIPDAFGPYLHIIIGFLGVPLGMIFGPDPYYFGILPIVVEVLNTHGVPPEMVARAMLIGENVGFPISPMVPSVYLAVGLAGVSIGEHIKRSFFWFWGLGIVLMIAALILGVISA